MKHAILVLLLFYVIEARSAHRWSTLPPHTETPPPGTEPMKKSVTEVKGESSWTPKPSSPSHSGEILSTITTTPPPGKFPDNSELGGAMIFCLKECDLEFWRARNLIRLLLESIFV
nr:unnamed protein product [Spirometra erinaceieuropaei]